MTEDIKLESSEFSSGISLIDKNDEKYTNGIFYYTIKTTTECKVHGEILLLDTINYRGARYCGKCYEDMLQKYCKEV